MGSPVEPGEPRSRRRLIVTAIVAAAVGVGAGIAAGYQIGDDRAPAATVFAKPTARLKTPYGSVTKVAGGSITIAGVLGRETVVETGESTIVAKSGDGSVADIVPGETIIVSGKTDADGVVHADQIVVLPKQWLYLLR